MVRVSRKSLTSLPANDAKRKLPTTEEAPKPAAKRAKSRKPSDFDKLRDGVWKLVNSSTGASKTEDSPEAIVDKVAEEVNPVKSLGVKCESLWTLGAMVSSIFNAEPSRKTRELRYGTAPPKLNEVIMEIVKEMSKEERAEFIGSEQGPEWRRNVECPNGYGGARQGPQPGDVIALFKLGEGNHEGIDEDKGKGDE